MNRPYSHMSRLKLIIQYKGTNFYGWQTQKISPTVQEVLEKKFYQIIQKKVSIIASGRTDTGVHALAQVAHVEIPDPPQPPLLRGVPKAGGLIDLQRLRHGLNSILPPDIVILSLEAAKDDFHAQFSAKKKTYDYYVWNSSLKTPFLNDYVWQIPVELDLKEMKKAAKYLVGEHDFSAFCDADAQVKTKVRRVYKTSIQLMKDLHPLPVSLFPHGRGKLLKFSFTGNGFLKHMIRCLAGTLTDVGKGKITSKDFKKIIESKDRKRAGRTAPAKGLFLREVKY